MKEKRKEKKKEKKTAIENPTKKSNTKFYYTESNMDFVEYKDIKKDWKNKLIEKWNNADFLNYMKWKFYECYNYKSLEFGIIDEGSHSSLATGALYMKIKKKLINVFNELKMGKDGVKRYIDWIYDKKSSDVSFPITLNFLCSTSLITEWMGIDIKKNKKVKNKINKKIYKPE